MPVDRNQKSYQPAIRQPTRRPASQPFTSQPASQPASQPTWGTVFFTRETKLFHRLPVGSGLDIWKSIVWKGMFCNKSTEILLFLLCRPSPLLFLRVSLYVSFLQQVKRNIAIFAVPALALGVFTCVALRVFFVTSQTKYCYFVPASSHPQRC